MDNSAQNPSVPTSPPPPVAGSQQSNDLNVAQQQLVRLGEKVAKADLPDDLRQTLSDRVKRLELIQSSAGFLSPNYVVEYDNANNYINWATGLPWNAVSQDKLDITAAKQILDK